MRQIILKAQQKWKDKNEVTNNKEVKQLTEYIHDNENVSQHLLFKTKDQMLIYVAKKHYSEDYN